MHFTVQTVETEPKRCLGINERTKLGRPTRKRSEARAARFIAMTSGQIWRTTGGN
jgi:hypothetical protein